MEISNCSPRLAPGSVYRCCRSCLRWHVSPVCYFWCTANIFMVRLCGLLYVSAPFCRWLRLQRYLCGRGCNRVRCACFSAVGSGDKGQQTGDSDFIRCSLELAAIMLSPEPVGRYRPGELKGETTIIFCAWQKLGSGKLLSMLADIQQTNIGWREDVATSASGVGDDLGGISFRIDFFCRILFWYFTGSRVGSGN